MSTIPGAVVQAAENPVAVIVAEALTGLNAIITIIAHLHAQGAMTPDQILASVKALTQANNTLFESYISSLATASTLATAATPPPPTPTP